MKIISYSAINIRKNQKNNFRCSPFCAFVGSKTSLLTPRKLLLIVLLIIQPMVVFIYEEIG